MRRSTLTAAGVAALLATASMSHAQEIQTYAYDVHGRLVSVTRTAGGVTRTTVYGLDDANNRTSRATTVSTSLSAVEASDQARAMQISAAEPGETPREPRPPEPAQPAASQRLEAPQ